jgi:hypothetical protein
MRFPPFWTPSAAAALAVACDDVGEPARDGFAVGAGAGRRLGDGASDGRCADFAPMKG